MMMGNLKKIVIDCDPGLDDAVALLVAFISPELIVLGITTTAGNVSLKKTQYNARQICELSGRPDMKVFAGCPRSMLHRYLAEDDDHFEVFAPPKYVPTILESDISTQKFARSSYSASTVSTLNIHGDSGLRGAKLPPPSIPLQEEHAVNFIIRSILENPKEITMVCTGPLTNLSTAMIMMPNICSKIKQIVLMGGSMGLGNITPAAEYNFFCDPEAARVVFSSGVPIVMIGLDVTQHAYVTAGWMTQMKALGSEPALCIVDMLENSIRYDMPSDNDDDAFGAPYTPSEAVAEKDGCGQVLHDVHTIAYLLDPSIYRGREVHVEIDTSDSGTLGRCTVDWNRLLPYAPNALVMNRFDKKKFFELLTARISAYSHRPKL